MPEGRLPIVPKETDLNVLSKRSLVKDTNKEEGSISTAGTGKKQDRTKQEKTKHDSVGVDCNEVSYVSKELARLSSFGAPSLLKQQTPFFVMSRAIVKDNLDSHSRAVQTSIDALALPLGKRMCLSIKTQPHRSVLKAARESGYLAEVITVAEMRTCLDIGWKPGEIVLNGPGKWYDVRSDKMILSEPLFAIFADSLADLKTIVDRILDPKDWLKTKVMGLRLSPFWPVTSRFGMSLRKPEMLLAVAEQLRRLPRDVELGLHFHFASSKLGPDRWLGQVRGFISLAKGLNQLCDRALKTLDFGGGYPQHLLDEPFMIRNLTNLLRFAQEQLPDLETVLFEPGKAITERAGAIITKVLEVREGELALEVDREDERKVCEEKDERKSKSPRIAVVDANIANAGSLSLHPHPLLYRKKKTWQVVGVGVDRVVCAEAGTTLGKYVSLPKTVKRGDFILLAFCGAYDISMSPSRDNSGMVIV